MPQKRIAIRQSNRIERNAPRSHRSRFLPAIRNLLLLAPVFGQTALAGDIHHYTVTVDYRLSQLWVEARFATPVKSVTARSRSAGKFLLDVRDCDDYQQVRLRNRRMMLPDDGVECLDYAVDLERAAKEHRSQKTLGPGNIIVSPSLWLWRPEVTGSTELEIRFRLPENVQVSVPWPKSAEDPQAFHLRQSPESSNASVVFGKFHMETIQVPGAELRVSMLSGRRQLDHQFISNWLRATATDITLAYGRFPNPSPQVIVIPVEGSDNAVPFGRVVRDGGEAVELLVNPERPPDEFFADWTATHEFSHMMLPYLGSRDRWVSEGFAQYYQNVLLARSGTYDHLHAWQKLYEGFERGRKSRPEMSPNEAAAGRARNGLMKVYWSGAALALIADVQLRERSRGRESLDLVLDRFQACCLPSNRVWSGSELFTKLDSLSGESVLMPLYRRYANTAGFPDVRPILEQLGLAISNDKVKMRRSAELMHIRESITRTDTAIAAWRQSLVSNDGTPRSARAR